MKNIVLLFLLLISQLSLGQNHKIAQLLNKQLQKEMTHFYNEKERKRKERQPFQIWIELTEEIIQRMQSENLY